MTSAEILDRLIAFPSVSQSSNRDIATFIASFLTERGIAANLLWSADGEKANLVATLGPRDTPGIILSGHMDVVPADGQAWTSDPFRLRARDGRLFGRGAADMKGFLACALSFFARASSKPLAAPLHLCFSHDEEIGCVGVRPMLDHLRATMPKPRLCIVGEPTGMRLAIGHKGKLAARATCVGREGHSALAPQALNAIHLASDFIGILRRHQDRVRERGGRDPDYDIPFSTIHAGRIEGGGALNIVPNLCAVLFEIRTIGSEDGPGLLDAIKADAEHLARTEQARFPTAAVAIEVINAYPGLDTPASADVVAFVGGLIEDRATMKVAFGTEGGLFAAKLGAPTVICGPGSMAQGHRPDEFVTRAQLDACDAMLDRLAAAMAG